MIFNKYLELEKRISLTDKIVGNVLIASIGHIIWHVVPNIGTAEAMKLWHIPENCRLAFQKLWECNHNIMIDMYIFLLCNFMLWTTKKEKEKQRERKEQKQNKENRSVELAFT